MTKVKKITKTLSAMGENQHGEIRRHVEIPREFYADFNVGDVVDITKIKNAKKN